MLHGVPGTRGLVPVTTRLHASNLKTHQVELSLAIVLVNFVSIYRSRWSSHCEKTAAGARGSI